MDWRSARQEGRMPSLAARRRLGALAAGLCSTSTAATTPTPAQTEAMRSTAMDFAPLPASIPAMAQQLVDDGFLHFPAALNPDKTAELKALLDWAQENPNPDPEAKDRHPSTSDNVQVVHIKNLWNRRPDFLQFADHEPVCSVMEAVLGDDCKLIGMTGHSAQPGRSDQTLHTDYLPVEIDESLLVSGEVTMPVMIITCHYYLTDLRWELGPTRFIRGSHVAGRKPDRANAEDHLHGVPDQPLMVKAGDCVAFRSDVWHRGSANTSNEVRHIMQVHYATRWMNTRFPPYLVDGGETSFQMNPVCWEAANPRQRRLITGDAGGADTAQDRRGRRRFI